MYCLEQVSVFCTNCTTAALVLQFKEDSATLVTTSNTTTNTIVAEMVLCWKGNMFNYILYVHLIGTTASFNLNVFIVPVEMFSML